MTSTNQDMKKALAEKRRREGAGMESAVKDIEVTGSPQLDGFMKAMAQKKKDRKVPTMVYTDSVVNAMIEEVAHNHNLSKSEVINSALRQFFGLS